MKQTRTILLLLLLSSSLFLTDCKKGEDDPFFSLRTRKARVTGEWTVKSGKSFTSYSTSNYSRSSNYDYSESSYSYTHNEDGVITTSSGSSKITMKFEKDGTVQITSVKNNSTYISIGTWNFTNGVGSAKKKEQIVIHIETGSGSSGTYTYTGNVSDITFNIKELRNKKMVIIAEDNYTSPTGTIDKSIDEYTLEQK